MDMENMETEKAHEHVVMHTGKSILLTNDAGYKRIDIGIRKFGCMGASYPFDHPHIYLTIPENETSIVCPYCSTVYAIDTLLQDGVLRGHEPQILS